jgi:hypothetical protein
MMEWKEKGCSDMKNFFLMRRELKQEILVYVDSSVSGVGEDEIVDFLIGKFNLYNSNNPYQILQWGIKIRGIVRKLAANGIMKKYSIFTDGDITNWYVAQNSPPPAWLDVLEEGVDWTI